MKNIYDLSNSEIAGLFIGSGLFFALFVCLGFCGLLYGVKKRRRRRRQISTGCESGGKYGIGGSTGQIGSGVETGSNSVNSIFKEQSQSVLRGEHPITFVLPTVPVSEASGSDCSDLESLNSEKSHINKSQLSTNTSDFHRDRPDFLSWPSQRNPTHSGTRPKFGNYLSSSRGGYTSDTSTSPRSSPIAIPTRGGIYPFRRSPSTSLESNLMTEQPLLMQQSTFAQDSENRPSPSMNIRYRYDSTGFLYVAIGRIVDLDWNEPIHPDSQMYIRIILLPDKSRRWETRRRSIHGFSSSIFDGESFQIPFETIGSSSSLDGNQHPKTPRVLKFSILERNRITCKKSTFGYSILQLPENTEESHDIEHSQTLQVLPSVSHLLARIFSDLIELSLAYKDGKLSLGILQAKLITYDPDVYVYSKVTLFEGTKVIKAKKTISVPIQENPKFFETFSIVLPESYLNEASCVISLCSKNLQGSKLVLGRTCIGGGYSNEPSSTGSIHWHEMLNSQDGTPVTKWHQLK